MSSIAVAAVQSILMVVLAPLASGSARWLRAKFHTRRGPSILQDYYDIAKLLKRNDVSTSNATFVSRIMPPLFLAVMIILACGIPMITRLSPVPVLGDIITIIYLMALPRFFFSLAGVDSSNAYAGVGGIRELLVGVLVEPTMMLAMFVCAVAAANTNIGEIGLAFSQMEVSSPVAVIVAGIAFAAACYIELGKLPYDMAEAEQELQEGPLAEYSGASLAMLKVAMSCKQIIVIAWFVAVFLPFGSAVDLSLSSLVWGALWFLIKAGVLMFVATIFENTVSRLRWKFMGHQTWTLVGIAALALVFCVLGV